MNAIGIMGLIIAVVATICIFVFIIPEKRRNASKATQFFHDFFNFKFLIIEKVLQATYILTTTFCIGAGFCSLFWVEEYSYGRYSHSEWMGGYGLLLMILGPIVLRLAYELILMLIIAVKNIIEINKKLKNQNSDEVIANKAPVFAQPQAAVYTQPQTTVYRQPQPPVAAQTVAKFCNQCGARRNDDGTCPNCGK